MPAKRTAIVLGATGLVGKALVHALLQDGDYSAIRLLVRKPLAIEHPRLIQEVLDFQAFPEREEPFAGDVLFITFGTTIAKAGSRENFRKIDHGIPLAVARRARQAGVSTLVLVSSVGADTGSMFFYSRVKGELERDIRGLGFDRVVLFRPSILLGDRGESRPAERVAMCFGRALERLRPGLLGPWSGMPDSLLAAAMVRSALDPEPGVHILHYPQTRALVANKPLDYV